jgi:hypothetical protein
VKKPGVLRVILFVIAGVSTLHGEVSGRKNVGLADTVTFLCNELLGCPTDKSVTVNLRVNREAEIYVEYGIHSGTLQNQTSTAHLDAGGPATITLGSLLPDTRYFYRVRYRAVGATEFSSRIEHTFRTACPRGRAFSFAIEADPHLDTSTNSDLYRRTLANILASSPDFLVDLGDTFMSDKLPVKSPQTVLARLLLLRSFYDMLEGAVPLLLVLGNHEGELGWLLDGTADNLAVWASQLRKEYYPNPVPDGFYSGDTAEADYVGLRQNYYAWEWGNALFVVLDPYSYTIRKPGASADNWDWTLGKTQYDWFTRTLENSHAGFKFVFAHQIVGGLDFEGRGGIEGVPYYEMGGFNGDSSWGFAAHRPGWPMPLHRQMVENNVTAFFHGHDHIFVKQDLDGIVYQELPQPGYYNFSNPEKSYTNTGLATKYGYTHGDAISSSGYLRVTVEDTGATVEYIRSFLPEHENTQRHNGDVAYSYVLRPSHSASTGQEAGHEPFLYSLEQNYPNPFNPVTNIGYTVGVVSRQSSVAIQVRLAVYDMLGREVAVLVDEKKQPGKHEVTFDAGRLASGVYFYRMQAGDFMQTRKLLVLR